MTASKLGTPPHRSAPSPPHARPRRGPRTTATVIALPLLTAALLAGCAHASGTAGADTVRSRGGATVVSGAALMDGHGSVLETLRGKVPGLKIRSDAGPCPKVTLRNDASYLTQVNPLVYVDGTRTTDTCVLQSIRSRDVESVEVYPTGVTTRPGYGVHAHGLILIFLRS